MSARLELLPTGPLARIDRAISLIRHGGTEALIRAWVAGAVPALTVIGAFWLERVEGVFELRAGIAGALVIAFCVRSVILADVSRRYLRGLWPGLPVPSGAGGALHVASAAAWVALGLVPWAIPLLLATLLGPLGVAMLLPLLALRGLNAPGWIARASCTEEGGLRLLRGAFGDGGKQRGEGFVVELLVIVGMLGLSVNLLATVGVTLLLSRSLLGLGMGLLDQFFSMRNTFVMLGVGLTAAVLFEPLRAALSAIHYAHARIDGEGLDVRAAIERAIEHASKRRQRPRPAAAALVLLGVGAAWAPHPATAQAPPVEPAPVIAPETEGLATDPHTTDEMLAGDAAVRARAERELSRPEYRELSDARGRGLRELLERWLEEWLDEAEEPTDGTTRGNAVPMFLPGPWFFITLGVLLVIAIAIYLLWARERPLPQAQMTGEMVARREDPRDRAPTEWLDDAARLAAAGRHRDALRALYLATLVALDRHRAITFDPTLTNWQYLRQLQGSHVRSDFRELTRIFDHKWYGQEETVEVDYQVCRQIAERLLARIQRGERSDARASDGEAAA